MDRQDTVTGTGNGAGRAERIAQAKEPIVSCEQCGMCSSACPITGVEGFNIRRIERAVQLGFVDDLLDSPIPWLCTTCGRCETACPNGYKVMTTTRRLRAMMAPDRVPSAAACRHACPAGMDAPRYIRLIAEGMFDAAYAVIRETAPLPGILGRVCARPCESKCRRADVNEPIAICSLKRFASDQAQGTFPPVTPGADTGRRVAVVGSGPAGLTAAFYLRKKGHAVTLYEAREEAGGMLRYGIPSYRLPQEVLDKEIGDILSLGVDFRPGVGLGDQVTLEQLQYDFDAVLVAVGAQKSGSVALEGSDLPDVLGGVEFLSDVRSGRDITLEGRVVIVGGGDVAIDAARTAARLGADSVAILYRRTLTEMPADPVEIQLALEEGIELEYLVAPTCIATAEEQLCISCADVELGEPDESGRRRPIVSDQKRDITADKLIMAIGQATDLSFIDATCSMEMAQGLIDVDPGTQATALDGVFAAGDAAVRPAGTPANVIAAIAAGRRAASSIDRYLGGDGEIVETLYAGNGAAEYTGERDETFADLARVPMPMRPVEGRLDGFEETVRGFDAEAAVQEARRCLNCDLEIALVKDGGGAAATAGA